MYLPTPVEFCSDGRVRRKAPSGLTNNRNFIEALKRYRQVLIALY